MLPFSDLYLAAACLLFNIFNSSSEINIATQGATMLTEGNEGSSSTPFFKTSAGGSGYKSPEEILFEKKKDVGQYVTKIDTHINKALQSQNKAVGRKRM